ncbi:hypothetical protein [Carboxylicivirga marina]|uniref:Bacteriocin n=1 Tax=Carboxylicivirga marina TaxID=2800988 RepID=A0ABS1HF39_9BACT|nr:hypothetical protein [Carboxylicivirga marina]MBK3515908.1 hypothetical protein [Carboxylicivirga marina]
MKYIEITKLEELTVCESKKVNGGAYDIWRAIGDSFGTLFAMHKFHAETAPWVSFGSK